MGQYRPRNYWQQPRFELLQGCLKHQLDNRESILINWALCRAGSSDVWYS